jgi:hypothetical protein
MAKRYNRSDIMTAELVADCSISATRKPVFCRREDPERTEYRPSNFYCMPKS